MVAVVVLFEASQAEVEGLVRRVRPEVGALVLVANGPTGRVDRARLQGIPGEARLVHLGLEQNLGLAAAQNEGLRWGLVHGFTRALLLDQDSQPAPGMIEELHGALEWLQDQGLPAAAVGPRYRDPRTGRPGYFVRWGCAGVERVEPADEDPPVEVDFLISSGTLLLLPVVEGIGAMDEGLFIDHVDTEWCLRAQARGYRLYGVPSAVMDHQIGGEVRELRLGGRVRHVSLHSPLRLYCNQRNSLLLHLRAYPSWRWRLADLGRMVMRLVYFGLVAPGRGENLRWMLRGIWDGLRGHDGPPPGWEAAA